METGLTASDVLAIQADRNRNYDDGMFGGNGSWAFFLFFLLAWGNGGWGGFGGNNAALQGALTRGDLCEGFNFNNLERQIQGVQSGICDATYALNNSLVQGFHGVDHALCSGFNGVNANITQARFDAQQCCCETNRNIDALRYENAKNTCDIMQNADRNTQRIIDQMNATEMQNLRDQLNTANLQLSQQAQSANLIATLRPTPIPAYPTCSPYESAAYARHGFNWNNGCGCAC